jgi:hypothetical protein
MFRPFIQREAELVASGTFAPHNVDPCQKPLLCQLLPDTNTAPVQRPLLSRLYDAIMQTGSGARLWTPKEPQCFTYPKSSCRNCSLLKYPSRP